MYCEMLSGLVGWVGLKKDVKMIGMIRFQIPDGEGQIMWTEMVRHNVTYGAVSYTHLTLPTIYSV